MKKKVNPIPEWLERQFVIVDNTIKKWSVDKQKWVGITDNYTEEMHKYRPLLQQKEGK